MEEPTCEIHPFSYSSAITNETAEENPMYGMEESVSFGRFTSESLSWEKWSTFNRNRYVEEAEKYSRPGSVKQKKAFLEAHFKRMTTLKDTTSSPDQANAIQDTPSEPTVDDSTTRSNHIEPDSQQLILNSEPSINDQLWVEKEVGIPDVRVKQNDDKPQNGEVQLGNKKAVGSDQAAQIQPTEVTDLEKQNPITESESGLTMIQESCLQSSSINQGNSAPAKTERNPPLSSYIPSVEPGTSLFSSSTPEKSGAQPPAVQPVEEMDEKSWIDDTEKKRTPLYKLINRKLGRFVSPVIKKIGLSSKASKTPEEKPKVGLCHIFFCGSKHQSNSFRERAIRETERPNT